MRIRFILFLFLSLTATAAPIILFSTFGPGNTFDETAYSLGGRYHNYSQAAAFTPAVSATLTQIDLPLEYVYASDARISLMTSVDGRPGVVLESFVITGITALPRIRTVMSVTHPLLTAGTEYWLAGSNTSGFDGRVGWNYSIGTSGMVATKLDTAPWPDATFRTLPAFDVLGEPVPEPASLLMLASGLIALAARRIRA